MSGVIPSNLKNDVSISNRFPEVHKRGIHTHTHTLYDSIRRNAMSCILPKNAYVTLNSDRYPAVDHNLSFEIQKFSRVYGDAALFGVKFFPMDDLITKSNITPSAYKTLYPLFTFDVSKQKQKLKFSAVDIQTKANTENVPANTRALALDISDKMFSFQSDCNKISVMY